MPAIAEARDLLKAARARKLERRAYLPLKLQYRIERTEEEQQEVIGGSWLPLGQDAQLSEVYWTHLYNMMHLGRHVGSII